MYLIMYSASEMGLHDSKPVSSAGVQPLRKGRTNSTYVESVRPNSTYVESSRPNSTAVELARRDSTTVELILYDSKRTHSPIPR
jgi:hypothetical protein